MQRQSILIVSFENLQEIDPEYLEDHAEMIAVGAFVEERIEQVQDMCVISIEQCLVRLVFVQRLDPLWIVSITGHLLKNLNLSVLPRKYFVVGGLQVVRRALHNLHCHVVTVLKVFGQPHRREMTPTQLLHQHVAVHQDLPNMAGVVTEYAISLPADVVVLNPFVFAVVLIIQLGYQCF